MMHSLTTLHEVSTTHHTLAGTIHDNPLSCRYLYSLDCEMDSFAPQSSSKEEIALVFRHKKYNIIQCFVWSPQVIKPIAKVFFYGPLHWPYLVKIQTLYIQQPGSVVTSCDLGNVNPTFPDASKSAKHHPPPAAMATAPATKTRAPLQSITHLINIIHLDKCVHASVHAKRRRSRRFLDGLIYKQSFPRSSIICREILNVRERGREWETEIERERGRERERQRKREREKERNWASVCVCVTHAAACPDYQTTPKP